MADRDGADCDVIVSPWHLDEHLPDFPVPVGAAETSCRPSPAGPAPVTMTLVHQAVADMVASAARPLLLSGDCPAAVAAVAGLQRRHRDLAVVWLDAHGDFNTPLSRSVATSAAWRCRCSQARHPAFSPMRSGSGR